MQLPFQSEITENTQIIILKNVEKYKMPKGACKGQQRKKGLGAEFLGKVPAMHVVTPEQSPQTGRLCPPFPRSTQEVSA